MNSSTSSAPCCFIHTATFGRARPHVQRERHGTGANRRHRTSRALTVTRAPGPPLGKRGSLSIVRLEKAKKNSTQNEGVDTAQLAILFSALKKLEEHPTTQAANDALACPGVPDFVRSRPPARVN